MEEVHKIVEIYVVYYSSEQTAINTNLVACHTSDSTYSQDLMMWLFANTEMARRPDAEPAYGMTACIMAWGTMCWTTQTCDTSM